MLWKPICISRVGGAVTDLDFDFKNMAKKSWVEGWRKMGGNYQVLRPFQLDAVGAILYVCLNLLSKQMRMGY